MAKLTSKETFKSSHKICVSILTIIGLMGLAFGITIFLIFGKSTTYNADVKSKMSTKAVSSSTDKKNTNTSVQPKSSSAKQEAKVIQTKTNKSIQKKTEDPVVDSDSVVYTIQQGDSLSTISQKFGTSIQSIMQQTNIKKSEEIFTGEVLTFSKSYVVKEEEIPAVNTSDTVEKHQEETINVDNGNKVVAGALSKEDRTYVLSQLQSRTGVDASQWDYIISRESGWDLTIKNSIGYYGLFQLAPGYKGYDGDVAAQIEGAVYLFNHGGMAHWAL